MNNLPKNMTELQLISKTMRQGNDKIQSILEIDWKVENVSSLYTKDAETNEFRCKLYTPPFSISDASLIVEPTNESWRVVISLQKGMQYSQNNLSAQLRNFDNEDDCDVELDLSLLDEYRRDLGGERFIMDDGFCRLAKERLGKAFRPTNLVILFGFDMLRLLTSDALIISCKIGRKRPGMVLASLQNLHNDFENLFELLETQPEFGDVTFRIGEKELRANKGILSVRSKVFQAMFTHDMKERNENIIPILDFNYGVMKELVRFVYCGRVKNLDEIALDLIVAADKYDLLELKTICEQAIIKSVSLANVFNVFRVACTHGCDELRIKASEFVRNNLQGVMETLEFENLKKSNPTLLVDLITTAVKK